MTFHERETMHRVSDRVTGAHVRSKGLRRLTFAALRATLFAALLGTSLVAAAAPVSAEYVFGDSLSDNGNLAEAFYHQNFPNPPSYHDSFTNGPVAAQLLANKLGLQLNPSLWLTGFQDPFNLFGGASYVPGTNYAVAGATSATAAVGGIPGINLGQQVAAFSARSAFTADPNALYVIDIGGNDVRNAALQGTGSAAVATGVQTELAAIQALAAIGARNFFVVNVPNVGVIPEFTQDNASLAGSATIYSQLYDQLLSAGLAALGLPAGAHVTQFDLYAFNAGILANPSAYGLTNTQDRCYTNTPFSPVATAACGVNAANINQFVYWDAIHPTETVQALWATGFERALGVPEPSGLALLGIGLVAVVGSMRRRRG